MRKYLREPELEALIQAPKRLRDRLIIQMLYETGARVGELVALDVEDIDLENEEIAIQRAKRHPEGRRVPLVDASTTLMLRDYMDERRSGPVFLSTRGTRISRRQVERIVSRYGAAAGIDPSKRHPHILRHTHAVNALMAGIDLRTLRDNLGHADLKTTGIYLASATDFSERKEKYRECFRLSRTGREPLTPRCVANGDFGFSFVVDVF